MIFDGYRIRPDLTRASRRGDTLITQDRGEWTADGRLRVRGRLDDQVITGGLNVDLAQLERACRSWPGLCDADIAVMAVPDPQWGTTIIAVTDGDGDGEDLRQFLGRTLPGYAVPRRLVHLDQLPRTGSGKLDQPQLADRLRSLGSAGSVQ
jgi:O-succinylbenzoic acid--CoA ligase